MAEKTKCPLTARELRKWASLDGSSTDEVTGKMWSVFASDCDDEAENGWMIAESLSAWLADALDEIAEKDKEIETLRTSVCAQISGVTCTVSDELYVEPPKLIALPSGEGFRLDLYLRHRSTCDSDEPDEIAVQFTEKVNRGAIGDGDEQYTLYYSNPDAAVILAAIQKWGAKVEP